MTHICIGKLTIIGADNGLSPGRRQVIIWTCWNIVNWTLRNKLHWNFNRNSNIFIQENALESVVCEMATILSRPQCVNVRVFAMMYKLSRRIGPHYNGTWLYMHKDFVFFLCITEFSLHSVWPMLLTPYLHGKSLQTLLLVMFFLLDSNSLPEPM